VGIDINILQAHCDECENEILIDAVFELGTSYQTMLDAVIKAGVKSESDIEVKDGSKDWYITHDVTLCPECKPKPKYSGYSDGDVPKLKEYDGGAMINFLESQGIDDCKAMGYIVDAYDAGTPEERRLINLVLVALYGWTLESIFQKAVG
jgi:hypothetical protein